MKGVLVLLAGAAVAAAPLEIGAQGRDTLYTTQGRVRTEVFLAQYSSVDGPNGGEALGGFGGRVMFGRGDVPGTLRTFFSRARAGGFIVYTAEQKGFSTTHFGGQLDFPLFSNPILNGAVDPIFSLAAGGFRVDPDGDADDPSTDFAVTPGLGISVPILGGNMYLRGDVRDVIVFGDDTSNNLVAEGGLGITF